MIEGALVGLLARHWKGLTALALAALLGLLVVLTGGGVASGISQDTEPDLSCMSGPGSVVDVTAADLTPKQRKVVSEIVRAGRDAGVPDAGIVIGLAVAYQEGEAWTTPDHGDAAGPDSVGDFQQRDWWGPRVDRLDTYKAATMFYTGGQGGQDGLLDIVPPEHKTAWTDMQPSRAGNAVQRSAHPDAYAKHLARAQAVLASVSSTATPAPAAACAPVVASAKGPGGVWPVESNAGQPHNLTPRTLRVRQVIETTFGETNIGGYATGGHVARSDHYTGNAVDVMLLPWADPARIAQGNRICTFLVQNWDALAVKYVIYRKQITFDGVTWNTYSNSKGSSVTLDHYDHVHVSVH